MLSPQRLYVPQVGRTGLDGDVEAGGCTPYRTPRGTVPGLVSASRIDH